MTRVDIETLKREIKEIRETYAAWSEDNAFVHWFLQAFLTSDREAAAQAVTGASGDKDVDAVFIDDNLSKVFVLQGKYHKGNKPPQEKRDSVLSFAQLARIIPGPEPEFATHCENLDPNVAARLLNARKRIRQRNFGLALYYVTTGRCSGALKAEAESVASRVQRDVTISIFDRADVLNLLVDYLSGAAPPVPFVDLRLIGGPESLIHRFDEQTDIDSWILTMSGRDLAQLYEVAGDRLFARNIRGFLGDTKINDGMASTLQKQPEYFWYFNNGVTIVCNSARTTSERGTSILRVNNPQIINGQQTTRTLHQTTTKDAAVLVRVISIQRSGSSAEQQFESLVSNIVAATNWQNAILPSDLRSNDARQVALERDFAKVRYHYLRKRQTKREAKRVLGSQHWFRVKKEELAQVVGACDLDPQLVRSGKEGLFEPPTYDRIFDGRTVQEYLSMYWLGRLVKRRGSGKPNRPYAKWHVLHMLWNQVRPVLSRKRAAEYFRAEAERNRWSPALDSLTQQIYLAALTFYRLNKGEGDAAVDISNFFYRTGQHRHFQSFWNSPENTRASRAGRELARFKRELDQAGFS